MTAKIVIHNILDAEISLMDFGEITPGMVSSTIVARLYNSGTTTPTTLDFGVATGAWNFAGDRNSQGQEAVTEQWFEARVSPAAFAPIGGDPLTPANLLSLTPISAGASVDVDIRVNPPIGMATAGKLTAIPFAFFDGDAP